MKKSTEQECVGTVFSSVEISGVSGDAWARLKMTNGYEQRIEPTSLVRLVDALEEFIRRNETQHHALSASINEAQGKIKATMDSITDIPTAVVAGADALLYLIKSAQLGKMKIP